MSLETRMILHCDYPDCRAAVSSEGDVIDRLLDTDGEWLILHDDWDDIKGFCPTHLRRDGWNRLIEYDYGNHEKLPDNSELIPYYEYGGGTYWLPKPECETTILHVLKGREQ